MRYRKDNPRAQTLGWHLYAWMTPRGISCILKPGNGFDFELEKTADERFCFRHLQRRWKTVHPKTMKLEVKNTNRTFASQLGSEVTRRFGNSLAEDTITIRAGGHGGQSFGAFLPAGVPWTTGDC